MFQLSLIELADAGVGGSDMGEGIFASPSSEVSRALGVGGTVIDRFLPSCGELGST